ncbi:MAG: DUF3990 domain-containing protein [Lachnospiraceae bacterium]|nr:DUF3990 domain-containing protein [Lachnospiraceae bacterium]
MKRIEIYHGSGEIVRVPEIRRTKYAKDFSWGFYCTKSCEQAFRWALRRHEEGIVNVYSYVENDALSILRFPEMTDAWLDFIAECRNGQTHSYDIVEGPMADDEVWNYVNDFLNGYISRELFWEYAKFKHPTHQISFHTMQALSCITFERSVGVNDNTANG